MEEKTYPRKSGKIDIFGDEIWIFTPEAENYPDYSITFNSIEEWKRWKDKNELSSGGDTERVDLFEHPELIPSEVAEILGRYWEEYGDSRDYDDTERMLKEIEAKGYTFDYYLDNEPYGLRPISVKLNELAGYEEMANGGEVSEYTRALMDEYGDKGDEFLSFKSFIQDKKAETKDESERRRLDEAVEDYYLNHFLKSSGGETDERWFERLQNYVKEADKNLKEMAEKSGINFLEWKREILRDVNSYGLKTPKEQYELYVKRVGEIYEEFHKEKKAAGGKLPMPEKGTPEWHQLGIAYKTIKMPSEMAGVMGGMTKEEAWEFLEKYGFKKAVHIFGINDVKEFVGKINSGIEAPYVHAYYSDLGGEKNISILLTVSLDEKSSWKYNILENSSYAKLHIYRDGTIEKFSGSLPKMRKAKAKSQQEVIEKINSYLNTVKMEKGGSAGSLENIYEKYRAKDYWDTAHDIKRKKEERDYFVSKGGEKAKATTDADIEKFYAEKEKSDFFTYAEKVKKALDDKDKNWLSRNLRANQKVTMELVELYTGQKAGKNQSEINAWIDKFVSVPAMGKGGIVNNNFKNIMKNIFSALADDGALITGGSYFGSSKMAGGGKASSRESKTKVKFLYNERNNDLFAYFPEEKDTATTFMAYSHIGQHSGASPEYAKESREATFEEYADLKKELENIGYNLTVLNKSKSSVSSTMADGGEAPDTPVSDDEKRALRKKWAEESNERLKKHREEKWATGKAKTREVFYVQGHYGQGWEDLTAHDTYYDAKKDFRDYAANEPNPHRIVTRRIKRDDYEKGNYEAGGNIENALLEFKRGRTNAVSLYVNGDRVATAGGGGYDKKGTVLGNWMQEEFQDELKRLWTTKFSKKTDDHYYGIDKNKDGEVWLNGAVGFRSMENILSAVGYELKDMGYTKNIEKYVLIKKKKEAGGAADDIYSNTYPADKHEDAKKAVLELTSKGYEVGLWDGSGWEVKFYPPDAEAIKTPVGIKLEGGKAYLKSGAGLVPKWEWKLWALPFDESKHYEPIGKLKRNMVAEKGGDVDFVRGLSSAKKRSMWKGEKEWGERDYFISAYNDIKQAIDDINKGWTFDGTRANINNALFTLEKSFNSMTDKGKHIGEPDFTSALNHLHKAKEQFESGKYEDSVISLSRSLHVLTKYTASSDNIRKVEKGGEAGDLISAYSLQNQLKDEGYEWEDDDEFEEIAKQLGYELDGATQKYRILHERKHEKGGVIKYPSERLPVSEQSEGEGQLELYIDNDGDLYRQQVQSIRKNLITKLAQGKFDINLAPKIYIYLIENGQKKFMKEVEEYRDYGIPLSKAQKENLAKEYVNRFLDEAELGNYNDYLPKKYKGKGGVIDEENKTEEDYEEYLNEIGGIYGYESDEWIIGGKNRYNAFGGKYGSAMRKHDPIAFSVGFNEWNL